MTRRRWTAILAAALVAGLLAGTRGEPARAAVQASPSRIVSLVPAVTEMLFAMGAGPAVVAVSSFDRFPPEAARLPKVGALLDPDFERVLSLRPDLVVIYGSQTDLATRLTRASIPHFSYRDSTLGDLFATMRQVGVRVGRAVNAERLAASIERDLEAVRTRVSGRARPRTALIFDREPGSLRGMYASGGRGFLHDLLSIAGGENVFGDVARDGLQVTSELLLARRPEIIIELVPSEGWPEARIARERALWTTLSSIPAVRSGRIHILADSSLSIPGPRVARAAAVFAAALHGER